MNGYAFEIPSIVFATLTLSVSTLAAGVLLWKLKPSSPRIHRFVWLAVLINGVILWRVPLDLPVLDPSVYEQTQLSNGFENGTEDNPSADSVQGEAGIASRSADPTRPIHPSQHNEMVSATPDSRELADGLVNKPARSSQTAWIPNWQTVLFSLWLAGAAFTLTLFVGRYVRILKRLAHSQPAKTTWQCQLDQIVQKYNDQTNVPLMVHPNLGPLLIATPFQTRIVVPRRFWEQLSPLQRGAILNHEVAHLVRRDIWTSMFATGLATVHWFNPLSWIALGCFNQAAEWACDQHAGTKDSPERTGFARALLSLSAGDTRFLVGASGIASTNLVSRVERLLVSQSDDTAMRKVLPSLLIGGIVLLGWFNVRLVTADPPAPTLSSISSWQDDEDEIQAKLRSLTDQIEINDDDELTTKFVEVVNAPAGIVAVSNRVGAIRNQMRKEASKTLIPEYFKNQLTGNFRERITKEVNLAKSDIEKMTTALTDLNSRLTGESEADQILARLLANKNAADAIYFSQFREKLRPGRSQVLQRLGRFLARDGNGKFIVRESVKDEFVEQLKNFDDIDKHLNSLGTELKNWSEEVVPKDDMHKRVKIGLARPESAARVLAAMQGEGDIQERIERYFRFLERILVDSAEGLVIPEDQRELVKASIESADLQIRKIDLLRQPVQEIANAIEVRGEAEQLAKDFMLSEFGLTVLVKDIEAGVNTPEAIADRIKSQALEETDDGNLRVREDLREQVTKFAREMLSATRRFRRQTMILDDAIGDLEDDSLKSICDTIEARMILIEKIEDYADGLEYDAWSKWIEAVFDETENGLSIRPEAKAEISEIIDEADKIKQEMQKDDF